MDSDSSVRGGRSRDRRALSGRRSGRLESAGRRKRRGRRAAKQSGAKLVVDLCDDHFDTPDLAAAYHELCDTADLVTASTASMAATIERRTGRNAVVIDDPYEGPLGDPLFYPGLLTPELRLVWFGHPVNFDTVAAMLRGLRELATSVPLELHLVTDLEAARRSPLFEELQSADGRGFKLRLTAWSPRATWQALAQSDIVLLPSLPSDKKKVKSPNRAVEGVRAGRLVVAYPLPSYQELDQGLCLNEDPVAGIRWALKHPQDALARIREGQLIIGRRFAPRTIGGRWEAVLKSAVECESRCESVAAR
ncbi:MAG: hypothetical protein QM811_02910 [Pirellulales bacterium]